MRDWRNNRWDSEFEQHYSVSGGLLNVRNTWWTIWCKCFKDYQFFLNFCRLFFSNIHAKREIIVKIRDRIQLKTSSEIAFCVEEKSKPWRKYALPLTWNGGGSWLIFSPATPASDWLFQSYGHLREEAKAIYDNGRTEVKKTWLTSPFRLNRSDVQWRK